MPDSADCRGGSAGGLCKETTNTGTQELAATEGRQEKWVALQNKETDFLFLPLSFLRVYWHASRSPVAPFQLFSQWTGLPTAPSGVFRNTAVAGKRKLLTLHFVCFYIKIKMGEISCLIPSKILNSRDLNLTLCSD